MKVKLLFALCLLVCQFSFSQTENSLKGKVSFDNILLQNVDVINKTSKISTTTNEKGEFIITAKANDSLYFYAKEYYLQRLKLTSNQIVQNNLVVLMLKKPEELEEVVIRTVASSAITLRGDKKYEQGTTDEMTLAKAARKPKTGVYDGTIENGANIMRISEMILGLFIKEKEEVKKTVPKIEFIALAKNTCDQKFYLETLKLKPEQIELFLQFCEADPKSKALIKNHNVLSMMDFLSFKNIEFQRLKSQVN
jgi:hypothetical protein